MEVVGHHQVHGVHVAPREGLVEGGEGRRPGLAGDRLGSRRHRVHGGADLELGHARERAPVPLADRAAADEGEADPVRHQAASSGTPKRST